MLPRQHLLSGFLFSLILFFFYPEIGYLGVLIILLSTFFIDVDHYLYYVYRKKDWSLRNSYNWYFIIGRKGKKFTVKQKKKSYSELCFLHGIESIIILAVLSYFSLFFFYILLGFVFHQILDAIDLYRRKYNYDKIISFFYTVYLLKYKKHIEDI